MEHPEDKALERLLGQVKLPEAPLGFEHRVLARLREERERTAWAKFKNWWHDLGFGYQGGLTAACATLVLLASAGMFVQWEHKKDSAQVMAALEAFDQYQQNQEKFFSSVDPLLNARQQARMRILQNMADNRVRQILNAVQTPGQRPAGAPAGNPD